MSYPTIEVSERKTVILLGGYERRKGAGDRPVRVFEEAKLREAAEQDRDAVAFAYYFGKWIAAA